MNTYNGLNVKIYKKKFQEAFQTAQFEKVLLKIEKVLSRRIGGITKMSRKPQLFKKNISGKYMGYLYLIKNGPDRMRFNWKVGTDSSEITSIDFYDGMAIDPTRTVETTELNIVQIVDVVTAIYRQGGSKKAILVKESTDKFVINDKTVLSFPYKSATPFFDLKKGTVIPALPRNDEFFTKLYDEYMTWVGTAKPKKYISSLPYFMDYLRMWGVPLLRKVVVTKAEKEVKLNSPDENFLSQLFKDLNLRELTEDEVFEQLERKINMVLDKKLTGAIIVGTPGVGKSYTVEQLIAKRGLVEYKDWNLIKGKETTAKLYQDLWKYRTGLIVLDDCDQPLLDTDGTNMLKSATDTGKRRKVSGGSSRNRNDVLLQKAVAEEGYPFEELIQKGEWDLIHSIAMTQVDSDGNPDPIGPPSEFVYDGQVIAISNLFSSSVDTALQDRGGFLELKLNVAQILNRIEGAIPVIAKDTGYTEAECKGCIEWLRDIAKVREDALRKMSFRKFATAIVYYAIKDTCTTWQQQALNEIAKDPNKKSKGA